MNTKLSQEGTESNVLAQQLQQKIVKAQIWHTCLNCEYFQTPVCAKFHATPPPEVIVHGCDNWLPVLPF